MAEHPPPSLVGADADVAVEQLYAAHWRQLVRLSVLLVHDQAAADPHHQGGGPRAGDLDHREVPGLDADRPHVGAVEGPVAVPEALGAMLSRRATAEPMAADGRMFAEWLRGW